MNRTGQPQQRPPSMAPTPGMGGPFRTPYPPQYGMPPRNVVPGYPGLPNHRTQNMIPQPSPAGFIQPQRGATYPFAAGSGLQQQPQTHQAHQALQQQQGQQQAQPPSSTPAPSLPPHLQQSAASATGSAPASSVNGEVGLDPNDFPALGAAPTAGVSAPGSGPTASYASQAGVAATPGAGANTPNGTQNRDFTADDFPALGGQQTAGQANQGTGGQEGQHLNGYGDGLPLHTPGLLNIGQAQIRGTQLSETEKRNYLKSNAAWSSPNPTSAASPYPQGATPGQNGTSNAQHLVAPPGVPPPAQFVQQAASTPNPNLYASGVDTASLQPTPAHHGRLPQTPAQQILMSAADRWGLLGLIAAIKNADADSAMLSIGTDLGTMGLDMGQQGTLYSTFITPWTDSSAAHSVEPDFRLPACYNVHPPAPGPAKMMEFGDETLFYIFYSMPRDALQEIAAYELHNRHWRYHKEQRIWITKDGITSQSKQIPGGEAGMFHYWDADNWQRDRKEMTVLYADLEEKTRLPFAHEATLQMAASPAAAAAQQQQVPTPAQVPQRYQGVGVAAM